MDKVLITGGGGFLGRHLIKGLLSKYSDIEVIALSRDENDTTETIVYCDSDRLKPIIGDIREIDTLKYAMRGVDTVIHLAAMKHVDFCELYPSEAIAINTIAAMNLLKLFTGDTFIGMSTDKAIEATGCYGATKLLLEKLIVEQSRKDANRRYMVVRSGNIFGSSGSVIEKWRHQIKQSNKITVTSLEMTRFFINVKALADFIIEIIERGESGKIYVPFQKIATLEDLAKAIIELYGNKKTRLEIAGLREGEKVHEKLFSPFETNVVSNLKSASSQTGERLSIEEIKDWLAGC
ncbi:MAG TPA: polysaccharide biosynthesis protein [Dehalococcoidia bacterium]